MYIVMVLVAALAIYCFILVEEGHLHEAAAISSVTWAQYNSDCGGTAWKDDARKVK